MHLCLPLFEKISVLDDVYEKLRLSGHSHDFTCKIFVEALLKFGQMVKNSVLNPSDPKFRPLYLANDYDAVNRGIKKYLRKFNWYDQDKSENDISWKKEIPECLKKSPKTGGFGHKKDKKSPTSVLFVPNSNGGLLLKRLQQIEPKLERLSGYTVRPVESGGTPLSRLFNLDLAGGRCQRADCLVCLSHTGMGSSRCMKKSIVYRSSCQVCQVDRSDQGSYIGENGRTLYERSSEHRMDAEKKKDSSHIWKHWALSHPDMVTQPPFTFKVLKVHRSALERQLHEAIKISTDGVLNARCEFRQNLMKRLSVNFTERELREQDKLADRLDREAAAAVAELSRKLESNKLITSSNLICIADPLSDLDTMLDSDLFSDTSTKRSSFETNLNPEKRLNLDLTAIESNSDIIEMGRKSNGHSHYEFKNSSQVVGKPTHTVELPVETLRSTPGFLMKTPSTFTEAASLAHLKTLERKLVSSSPMNPDHHELQPREIFGKRPTTLSSLSSTASDNTSTLASDEEWGNVGSQEEGEPSLRVLSMTIDEGKQATTFSDSFSSDPETQQNKGALAFLQLLKETLSRQKEMEKSRLFESLVVQMIDISLEHKVPTANDIADTLTQKGWDLRQVAGVWSVSSDNSWDDCWLVSAIDRLGGKGTTARVWNELKEAHKTGFPKRPAGSEILEPRKRLRTDQHESKVMRVSTTAPSKMDSLADISSPSTSKVAFTQQSLSRKILRAGRKGKPMNKGKITWWLSQAKEESPEDQAPLQPSSPELIPPTPDTSKPK